MWDTPSDPPSEGFFTLGNVRDYEQRMRGAASGSGGPADLQRPPEGPPHQSRNISKSMGQHILQLLGGAPANGIPGGPGRPLPAGGGVPLQEAQRPPPGGSRGAPPRAQQLAGIERFAPDLNDEQLQKLILWASQNQKQQAVLRVLLQTVAERRHAKKKPPGWGRDDMGEVNGQDESPHRARRSAPPPQGVAPAQFAPIRGAKQQANTPSGMPPVPPVLAHEKGSSDVQRAMRPNAEAATSGGAVVEPKKSKLSANAATFHPLSFRPAPPQQQQQQYVLPPAPERPAAAAASAAWQMAADTGSAHHHHHHPSYPEASFGPPTGFCPHQQANHEARRARQMVDPEAPPHGGCSAHPWQGSTMGRGTPLAQQSASGPLAPQLRASCSPRHPRPTLGGRGRAEAAGGPAPAPNFFISPLFSAISALDERDIVEATRAGLPRLDDAHFHQHGPANPELTGHAPGEAGTDGAGHRREGAAWQSQPLPKL
eukprot:Polyplicarium_translucidae@DN2027_c0_g1_i4.p1